MRRAAKRKTLFIITCKGWVGILVQPLLQQGWKGEVLDATLTSGALGAKSEVPRDA